MEAREKDFNFILKETLIEIPFFQRAYVWKKEQWAQFFNDLSDSYKNKREHFLGSIILKQLSSGSGEGSKRSLIDGQQRLTTFSILVKSLYDKLDDKDKMPYSTFLFKDPMNDKTPRIKHSKIDRIYFEEILQAIGSRNLQTSENRLIACYKFLTENIELKIAEPRDFLDFILNSKLWVTIDLSENEDEQKIFDSVNTAGLKLTATDIIKNALFAKHQNSKYEKLYEKYWEDTFEPEKAREFWDAEIATGRLKRVRSEIFLHAFAIVEGFFNPEKDTLENLSDIYKARTREFSEGDLEKFLIKIKEYAAIYRTFPNIDKDTRFYFENDEQRLFHILKIIDTNVLMPLILALKIQLKNKDEELLDCLFFIEIFIFTRWVCGKSTEGFNKLLALVVRKLDKNNPLETLKNELLESIPGEREIAESLRVKFQSKKAALVLFWIELYREHQDRDYRDKNGLKYEYQLEHLMPQKWREHWSDVAENEEKANELIHQIGNMTLLKGKLNAKISNREWDTKLNGDGKGKGIKAYADLSINKELVNKWKWDEITITERTKCLTDKFLEIWDVGFFN